MLRKVIRGEKIHLVDAGRCSRSGKVMFDNKRIAKLVSFNKQQIHERIFKVYRCRFCKHFHLTTYWGEPCRADDNEYFADLDYGE